MKETFNGFQQWILENFIVSATRKRKDTKITLYLLVLVQESLMYYVKTMDARENAIFLF